MFHNTLPPRPTFLQTSRNLPQWVNNLLDSLNIAYNALSQTLYLNTLANKKKFDLRRDVSLSFQVGDKVRSL